MGILDNLKGKADELKGKADELKDKATELVDQHSDQITEGLDKASSLVDDKTGGKFHDKIESGVAKAKDSLDRLDGSADDFTAGPDATPDQS